MDEDFLETKNGRKKKRRKKMDEIKMVKKFGLKKMRKKLDKKNGRKEMHCASLPSKQKHPETTRLKRQHIRTLALSPRVRPYKTPSEARAPRGSLPRLGIVSTYRVWAPFEALSSS